MTVSECECQRCSLSLRGSVIKFAYYPRQLRGSSHFLLILLNTRGRVWCWCPGVPWSQVTRTAGAEVALSRSPGPLRAGLCCRPDLNVWQGFIFTCSFCSMKEPLLILYSRSRLTSLKSLRLQDLLTFGYFSLPLVTFPYLWLPLPLPLPTLSRYNCR